MCRALNSTATNALNNRVKLQNLPHSRAGANKTSQIKMTSTPSIIPKQARANNHAVTDITFISPTTASSSPTNTDNTFTSTSATPAFIEEEGSLFDEFDKVPNRLNSDSENDPSPMSNNDSQKDSPPPISNYVIATIVGSVVLVIASLGIVYYRYFKSQKSNTKSDTAQEGKYTNAKRYSADLLFHETVNDKDLQTSFQEIRLAMESIESRTE